MVVFAADTDFESYGSYGPPSDDKPGTWVVQLPLSSTIRTTYRGAVTRIATKGALPIAKAMGHEFFLVPAATSQAGAESF